MTSTVTPVRVELNKGLGHTLRRDAWWIEPVLTVLTLVAFGIYATWSALQGNYYEWGPYLSPFYSPNLKAMFPEAFSWVGFSPAFLIMWAPLGFRGTCYFYRRAYYRSFFMSPPACSVDEPQGVKYDGERAFPFILQNIHRYFFYIAAVLVLFHWTHVIHAFNFDGKFGIGVGTLIFLVDAIFLTMYAFSCHSWRHLIGGKLNMFSCNALTQMRHRAWKRVSFLNENHMLWAWISLFTVGFADLYVRLVASGVWTDYRIF
jgi:hypothetical protein